MASVKTASAEQLQTVQIPGSSEPFSLALPDELQALRDRALEVQRTACPGLPEITLADARAWQSREEDEDWLIWRARRCSERLGALQVELEAGESLVGKPRFRPPSQSEAEELARAQEVLAEIPPYPGGDSGHFHPDWRKLLSVGIGGILSEIDDLSARPGLSDEQRIFYRACRIVVAALSGFVARIGDECAAMADQAPDAGRWTQLAAICHRVAVESPATLHEAMQLLFATQIALWFGEDHGLTSPGRLDQTLRPYYEADIQAGRTSPRAAFELLCCLYIHQNRILWPGSAVAAMVGGRDRDGRDATNDLTYLALAARQATRLVYPTVGLAWHESTPGELIDYAMRMLATGVGDPALFNDEVITLGLRDHGVSVADSYDYMNSTCVEIKVCGASNMWVTAPYFNLPKGLQDVLSAVAEGTLAEPEDFEALEELVRENLAEVIRQAAESLDRTWRQRGRTGCFPLASCVISECLARGQDFDRGGARYNWVENSFVGLANLVDGLLAVKHLVFEERSLTLLQLHEVLQANYEGHEDLRQRILNALPHYGNDDPEADALARSWAEFLIATTEAQTVGLHRYVPGFFCWITHERMGSETGATPDGRLAGWPMADGAGGAQGREKCGPAAAVLSTTSWSHRPVLGGLVHNIKFTRELLGNQTGVQAARQVLETYLRRGGFEVQVNAVGRETLLDAQAHPERYRDLLVRVAGYSDYFVHLNRNMQDEVIARNEHEL